MTRAFCRIAVPLALLACVAVEYRLGADALPNWLANLSVKSGLGPERAVRLLAAFELLGAALALLSARRARAVAWIACAAFAFSALAELSAIIAAPGNRALPGRVWIGPILGLAFGGGGLWLLSNRPADPAPPPARFTPWRAMALVALAAASFGIAGSMTVTPRTDVTLGAGGVEAIALDPAQWTGKTFAQAGVAVHVPMLTPATLSGTKWVVFYRPSCGRCHQVMDTYFAGPQDGSVIAVKVPYGPGEEFVPGEVAEDVACAGCEMLELPSKRRWIITTPTIAKVEEGIITCVTWTDYDRCRAASESGGATPAPAP
jgi:uncharacterized membrane protein